MTNMIALYFFGTPLAAYLGGVRFLQLYMTAGIASNACFLGWFEYFNELYNRRRGIFAFKTDARGLGASGAVSAVVTVYILTNPTAIVMLYMIIPVPAFLLGIGYFISESYAIATESSFNVGAQVSHLSGAAVGASFYFIKHFTRFLR